MVSGPHIYQPRSDQQFAVYLADAYPDRHPGGRGQLRRRVVPQTAPSKWGGKTVHWADLYCGPITFQIRDQLGLRSALALLTRIHKTAVAVCISAHHV